MSEPVPLLLDFETSSQCDLRKCGSYVYAEHPSTKVLCAAMLINSRWIFWTPERWNITPLPEVMYVVGIEWLREMFLQNIIVIAHNVEFERPIATITLGLPEPSGGWADTMDQTLMRGLPAGADAAGSYVCGIPKDKEGQALMMKMCRPNKSGVMPVMTDIVMQRYQKYNLVDVHIQNGIVSRYGYNIEPEWEAAVNRLHRDVNHRGVLLDVEFARTLKEFDSVFKHEARREVEEVTKGEVLGTDLARNQFLTKWLASRGLQVSNLRQETINEILEADEEGQIELPVDVFTVLQNRLVVTRAALAKVDAALMGACRDGRLRSMFRYWGAHTGRFSGMRVQLQNLRRQDDSFDLPRAIQAVEQKDRPAFEECCVGRPPYVLLSSLIRSMLIPEPGCKLVIGDFTAIEARVLLWMADDQDGLQVHVDADKGLIPDTYCSFASILYKRPITKKDKKERGTGKLGDLSCGYQGGPNAILRFAKALGIDLTGIDPQSIVDTWRALHPNVVRMWFDVMGAIFASVRAPGRVFPVAKCNIVTQSGWMQIFLPSGRPMTYMNARIEMSQRHGWEESLVVAYDTAVRGRVQRKELSPGLAVENIDQGISRDLLVDAMLRLSQTDDIVLHIHDEAVLEVPDEYAEEACENMRKIMSTPPAWAAGLPLACKPFCEARYGK